MTEHLERAGLFMTDEQHRARVFEHFNDSNLILLNNEPIGVLKLGVLAQSLHIRQLQILPKYHGKGLGSMVLDVVKNKAKLKNKNITLSVLLANPAKNLYSRHGYEVVNQDDLQYYMQYSLPID
ncbi:GNAT family N-acetyltransferase [Thalassotalea atypica]|uniref:GNAT family N-acetyltransferase n=1 Tax=Thalassotalea atypica TaxID=2054316 RepID=UPI0025733F3C|nr:GNAT family N-acetyltransferase [Thalassotalea atypica]